jgi:hypothetical protein
MSKPTTDIKPFYGSWKVIENKGIVDGKTKLLCECKCGNRLLIYIGHLRSGHTKQCRECMYKIIHISLII